MNAARVLRHARHRAGLTQRALAAAAGVPQPVIARIESSRAVPRTDTLDRLLEACGADLELEPRRGIGIDRTVMRRLRGLSPRERLELAAEEARNLARFPAGKAR